LIPAWWLAGRVQDNDARPVWRLLWAVGLALAGYLSFVNLFGRLLGHSTSVALTYLILNAAAGIVIRRRYPSEANWTPLATTWRSWIGPVALALVVGLPQWFLAVSTNYFDEVA